MGALAGCTMTADLPPERQRCAIYTRKSLDIGLDQEFNSLETQRAICSAYVTSQAHRGWLELPGHYDDAGRSGANLDRPELQKLMQDIENGLVDMVLVYKLDRITRTLLDFVRLMDFFDRYGVSFVSITQSFDTSDSLGRLILNVLLTFAQFEREIFADRIRDKQQLIRRSGRWPSGTPPFGYGVKRHMLVVNRSEAAKVRFLFEQYLALGSFMAVESECRRLGIRGRRHKKGGLRPYHSITITAATVSCILHNPVYIGLLRCGTEQVPGLHSPIIGQELWDRVQERMNERAVRRIQRTPLHNLLCGILYDCFGRLMTSHHGRQSNGTCPEYYASLQNDWGRRNEETPLWCRGDSLEHLVQAALQELLSDRQLLRSGLLKAGCFDERLETLSQAAPDCAVRLESMDPRDLRAVFHSIFARIELARERVQAIVRWREVERYLAWDGTPPYKHNRTSGRACAETHLLDVPFSFGRGSRKLTLPISPRRSLKAAPSLSLLRLVHDARKAQHLVDAHRGWTLAELAARIRRTESYFVRLLRLNYLAPDILTSILDGTQPPELTRKMLLHSEFPLDWALQRRMLGFTPRPSIPNALAVSRPGQKLRR